MTRLYGRAQLGRRVHASSPHGHWQTTTMISSIRRDGRTACMMVDGATDTEVFTVYVRELLCPSLRAGDLVIMDNLAAHKSPDIKDLIEGAGARVAYLPPYSPDLNPIEKMWSKVKAKLRAAEARTQKSLIKAVGEALSAVTAQDAIGWFTSCGYNLI